MFPVENTKFVPPVAAVVKMVGVYVPFAPLGSAFVPSQSDDEQARKVSVPVPAAVSYILKAEPDAGAKGILAAYQLIVEPRWYWKSP